MLRKRIPGIELHLVLPERPALRSECILGQKLNGGNSLIR